MTTTGGVEQSGNVALGAFARNGASMTLTDTTFSTSGDGAHGVEAGAGSSVNISGGSVTTGGANAFGLFATDAGSSITTSNGVMVTTTGDGSNGVFVAAGATASLTDGSVATSGAAAPGVSVDGAGSTVTATGVTITTTGDFDSESGFQSQGVVASGSATATLNNVTVTTSGAQGQGVLALTGGQVGITGGSVSVSGADANGLLATGPGSKITTSGGLVVTSNATSFGYTIQGARADNSGALVLADTTITTSGESVSGVGVDTGGTASLDHVSVTTTGFNAYGAFAAGGGGLTLGGGTQINTSGPSATGLYVSGIGSTATLNSDVSVTVTDPGSEGPGAAGVLVDLGGAISGAGALTVTAAGVGIQVDGIAGGTTTTSINLSGALSVTTTTTNGAAVLLNSDNASFSATGGGTISATGVAIAFMNGTNQTATFTGFNITSGGDLVYSDPASSVLNFNNTTANAGTGNLANVTNGSTLTLNASNSNLTGAFATSGGSTSNFNLSNGSNWSITGTSNVSNLSVANASVGFAPGGATFHTLTTDSYTGSNATLTLNASFNPAAPGSDQLVINNTGTTGGTTNIVVHPTSQTGGATNVLLVSTSGSIGPGAFALSQPVVVGGQAYALQAQPLPGEGSGSGEFLVQAMSTGSANGSVASLAQSRQTAAITGKVLGSILTGATEQINCSSCMSGFASFGSFALGAHGRWSLSPSLTLLAGASYDSYSGRGVTINNSIIGAAALRYDPANMGHYRPFVEGGLAAQPYANVTFRRGYQTSANFGGSGLGVGTTQTRSVATFGRVGYIWRLSRRDEAAVYGDLSRSWQWTDGYAETANPGNPFAAQVAASLDTMNIWRVGGQYTHLFGEHVEANRQLGLCGRVRRSIRRERRDPGAWHGARLGSDELQLGRVGARLSYRFSNNVVGDAFVLGTVGAQPVGNQLHGGVALRMEF